MRVIPVFTTQNYGSGKAGMPEFSVGTLSAADEHKASIFKIGDQLTNLAGHTHTRINL